MKYDKPLRGRMYVRIGGYVHRSTFRLDLDLDDENDQARLSRLQRDLFAMGSNVTSLRLELNRRS